MRYFITLLAVSVCCCSSLSGQKHLEGLWEGTITIGGLHSQSGYKFELLIKLDGSKLKGRSYVHLGEDNIIEMDVRGYLYQDRSLYLQDIEFIPVEGSSVMPSFHRKYQMIYSRSIWESTLEGYWQEIITSPFDLRRQRGRITLKKVEESKA